MAFPRDPKIASLHLTVAKLKPRRKGTEERERTVQVKSAMRAFKTHLEFRSAQSDWVPHPSFVLLFIQKFGLGAERANGSRARDTSAVRREWTNEGCMAASYQQDLCCI